jgi:hypothetical protein
MNANTPHDANAVTRNNAVAGDVDRNIDCALAGLRDAQPRSGLNSRILASLEHRSPHPQRSGLDFSAHLALWTATSAAILAIASLIILQRQGTDPAQATQRAVILSEAARPHREAQSKNPETARLTTNPEPLPTANLTRPGQTASSRPEKNAVILSEVPQGRSRRTHVFSNVQKQTAVGQRPNNDLDAQALADLHAPSHPAPPLPLTPEEKLFRRMIQYRNATQLAELDPLVRAKENADETTAFKAFFPDPPPVPQPGDTE